MRCLSVTPLVPVANMQRAIDFYQDVLGFRTIVHTPDTHAYLQRDRIGVRLIKAGPGVDLASRDMQLACYVDVDDVDALWAELSPALDGLPEGRVRAPFDQPYGQREFHVIDEDAMLIFFGADTH